MEVVNCINQAPNYTTKEPRPIATSIGRVRAFDFSLYALPFGKSTKEKGICIMTSKPKNPENSLPRSAKETLARLEKLGRGEGPYAQALRYGLEEEKRMPGKGRAIYMDSMRLPDDPRRAKKT
jgi:hypothetical protein